MVKFTTAAAALVTVSLVNSSFAFSTTRKCRNLSCKNALQTKKSASLARRSIIPIPVTTTTRLFASSKEQQDEKPLLLYNSKSRQKEKFTTLTPHIVNMYTCGPTVYDSAHVGNFRAFLTYDILKRVLVYLGYTVNHVCNVTDVDDKIMQRCQELGITPQALTRQYEDTFQQDLSNLNVIPASHYPRATEHIDDMVEMILTLHKKGLAYQSEVDDSWYFDTTQQEGYGQQLVQLQVDEMESTSGDRNSETAKRHFQDFCLWKAYKPDVDLTECVWDVPSLGRGRPGWHLECSAMAKRYLGETLDVHCGGIDLKFPHHENEIAQSEGANGQPYCGCWIHNGFVNVENEKMSKSLGNFLTLQQACPTPQEVRAYRYLVVSSQYRTELSFTKQAMVGAKNAIKRMDKVKKELEEVLALTTDKDGSEEEAAASSDLRDKVVPAQLEQFETALRDDLSMPRASAALFALVKAAEAELKKAERDFPGLKAIHAALLQMDQVFGIFYEVPLTQEQQEKQEEEATVPENVLELVGQRTAAKEAKDWELADSLRARITELGFAVKDVKGGDPIVSRLEQ